MASHRPGRPVSGLEGQLRRRRRRRARSCRALPGLPHPLPRQRRRLLRTGWDPLSAPFSNCPSAGASVWGGNSPGGRQARGQCFSRRRERRPELRVRAVAGCGVVAVGLGGAAAPPSPPGWSPQAGPGRCRERGRGRGRKWVGAGRGGESPRRLQFRLTVGSTPTVSCVQRSSRGYSGARIACCPTLHWRQCYSRRSANSDGWVDLS